MVKEIELDGAHCEIVAKKAFAFLSLTSKIADHATGKNRFAEDTRLAEQALSEVRP
jgi:hypothetical protein